MKKEKNKNQSEEDLTVNEYHSTRALVSVINRHQNERSILDFDWPEFTKERDRIKAFSRRFKNMSISEAFGIKNSKVKEEPVIPTDLRLGDMVDVKISQCGDNYYFTNLSTKQTVTCKNNLSRFKNKPDAFWSHTFKGEVVSIYKDQVQIDILKPMFDEWISKIVSDPTEQYDMTNAQIVEVHDLQLQGKGFVGKAEIPIFREILGESYFVDAFIPGSHIVLNIEDDFEKWNGKTVQTFVSTFINKPNSLTQKSLVCSRKNFLTFLGDKMKIDMYKMWCDNDSKWEGITKSVFNGSVTGVINSSKKCGVFVEIPMLNITGMISLSPEEIVKYKPSQEVFVHITGFEDMTYYDENLKQRQHLEPYEIEDNKLRKCILKPILKLD